MLRKLDAQTTIMLLLPHLTPKEAVSLTAACKSLFSARVGAKPLCVCEYARKCHAEYEKFLVDPQDTMERIGRQLCANYQQDVLMKTTIINNRVQWILEDYDCSSYIVELKLNFLAKEPEVSCSYHPFQGLNSDLPDSLIVTLK
jgi:hypothetical protein